jgi:transposase-like protein
MHCCHCGSGNYHKSGKTKGKQRYKCKGCGYHFTNTHGRGKPPELRLQALKMHTESVGFRAIARLLGVDVATVVNWVRDEGRTLMQQIKHSLPESLDPMDIIEIDEMWHYTQKKSANCGYGLLYLASPDASSPSRWVLAVGKR